MAGIGFSLKRLFNKKGLFNLCKAYGYAGIVTVGPMLLGIVLLLGVSFVASLGGLSTHNRELLNSMITYSLLASLSITSIFNMTVTRYVSDTLYEGKETRIMPSLYGSVCIMLFICIMTYGVFLMFSGVPVIDMFLCLWLSLTLIVVWTEMIFMSAIKDYKSIVLSFAISLLVGFVLELIFVLIGFVTIESMLLGVIVAYGILAVRYLKLLQDYFPRCEGSCFSFLRWFDKYKALAISGIMINVGLFSHIIIMYWGELGVRIEGLFYGAPDYDVPALLAFFSLLITTVGFVTSVEVQFYPKYRNYYGLFNDKGAINDIKLVEKDMRRVLAKELVFLGHKQLFVTVLFIVILPQVIEYIIPGFSALGLSIFRFLCVGYGTYAIANSMMLILLYFEDYFGALLGCASFGIISTGVSIWQINYGVKEYYGMAFFIGAIVFYGISAIRLAWYTTKLPYFLLARQSVVPGKERGLFVGICEKIERREKVKSLKINSSIVNGGK